MDGQTTSQFYDTRGARALSEGVRELGSMSIPLHLRAPYEYCEGVYRDILQSSGDQFLDACCGTGIHGVYAAKSGFRVAGFDLSPASVNAAERLAESAGLSPKCAFSCEDFDSFIERTSKDFDVIYMSGSLYYLNVKEAVPRIKSRLKPQGAFIAVETYADNPLMSMVRRLCDQGASTRFFSTNLFFEEVAAEKAAGTYLRFIKKIVKANVLILDDFALRNYTHDEANTLQDILEERYDRGITVVTSQVSPEGWKTLFDDEIIAESIIDRLTKPSEQILLKGPSYRDKKESQLTHPHQRAKSKK